MATTSESRVHVWGYVSNRNGRTVETEKAVRVTLKMFGEESVNLDTTWIPHPPLRRGLRAPRLGCVPRPPRQARAAHSRRGTVGPELDPLYDFEVMT